jgi:hypothetical protein
MTCALQSTDVGIASRISLQSWLGLVIMLLVLTYHYVTADPRFEQQQQQPGQ